MKRKVISTRELSRISQKWHMNQHLTPEEDELLPMVAEWEKDLYVVDIEEPEEPSLEELYYAIYKVRL